MSELKRVIANALKDVQIDFGGGCSVSKAFLIAWLIHKYRIVSSVDIGVYRGRSLVPQAMAHKIFTKGRVYGVDPWSNSDAREMDNPALRESIDAFVDATNFASVYEEVGQLIGQLGLGANCTLIRDTSRQAIRYFETKGITFGLIHIDGNHDSERATEDVSLYLPRLISGGFVVLDDISWDSVKPAYAILNRQLSRVYQRIDTRNDYAVFWDARSRIEAAFLRGRLLGIGRG